MKASVQTAAERRTRGQYFTPEPIVDAVLSLALPLIPAGPITVVDPACGDGAFLSAAQQALPRARLHGLELQPEHARTTRGRVRGAEVFTGDALRGGWDALTQRLPEHGTELWLGNPPYNGTSPLLADPTRYRRLRTRLGLDDALPAGTSLRDDYAFFLLLAAERLATRPGVLAWVTSATLLDAFLYGPLRRRLLDVLALEEVVDLGAGAFLGTRVRTCITVWRSHRGPVRAVRFRRWTPSAGALAAMPVERFTPQAPDWQLRPLPREAAQLDAQWRAQGEPLDVLLPVHCTGLKTRFDELLVDADPARLLARVDAFLGSSDLEGFAARHAIPARLLEKLQRLRRMPGLPAHADRAAIRPFHRWAGARHRGGIPETASVFCYLDRRLIPRGDHRLVGGFDPHASPGKLVFNLRELPLAAALLERPGCVPAHRHARFAPSHVPARILAEGPRAGLEDAPLGPPVPNLSPAGLTWAERIGGPLEAYRRIAAFVNSSEVQDIWAPSFGTTRVLPVPFAAQLHSQQ
jgi:N-6 DNA Methylase